MAVPKTPRVKLPRCFCTSLVNVLRAGYLVDVDIVGDLLV